MEFVTNIGQDALSWLLAGLTIGQERSLLSEILFYVCSFALTGAVVITGWNTAMFAYRVGSKGTPQETALGDGLTVMRTVFGLALLAPIVNGAAPVHSIVYNFASISIAGADEVAYRGIDFLDKGGTITPKNAISEQGTHEIAMAVVYNEACHFILENYHGSARHPNKHFKTTFTIEDDGGKVFNPHADNLFFKWGWQKGPRSRNIYPSDCGSLGIELPNELEGSTIDANGRLTPRFKVLTSTDRERTEAISKSIQGQIDALIALRTAVRELIAKVGADFTVAREVRQAKISGDVPADDIDALYEGLRQSSDDIIAAMNDYGDELLTAISNYSSAVTAAGQSANEPFSEKTPFSDEVRDRGFLILGTFYNQAIIESARSIAIVQHRVKAIDQSGIFDPESPVTKEVAALQYTHSFVERVRSLLAVVAPNLNSPLAQSTAEPESADSGGFLDRALKPMNTLFIEFLRDMLTGDGNGDLVQRSATFGLHYLTIAEVALTSFLVILLMGKIATGALLISGNLPAAVAVGGASTLGSKAIVAIVIVTLALAIFFAFIGIIIPTLPMIHWLMASMSWALMLLMVCFFLPFWAMMHAIASQGGWVDEHTRNGYMALAEVLVRPTLNVCGFFAAMIAMQFTDILINIFADYILRLTSGDGFGLVGMTFVGIIMIFLTYKLVVRCFSLISEVADFIIERLGSGLKPMGDVAESQQAQTTIVAGGLSTSTNVAKQSASLGMKAVNPKPEKFNPKL